MYVRVYLRQVVKLEYEELNSNNRLALIKPTPPRCVTQRRAVTWDHVETASLPYCE